MKVDIKVQGLKELGQQMDKLDKKVRNRIARAATAAGARHIRDTAKAMVPVDTGQLKQNIVVKKFRDRQPDKTLYGIGLISKESTYGDTKTNRRKGRAGKSYWTDKAYYGHMVEFGTRKMPAQPFLRPALETQKEQTVAVVKKRLTEELVKEGMK